MVVRNLLPILLISITGTSFAQIGNSGSTPQDVAVADVDQDGLKDLLVLHAFDDSLSIQRQVSEGVFVEIDNHLLGYSVAHPAHFPRALSVADVNFDGFPDVTIITSGAIPFGTTSSIQRLINRGDGTFIRIPSLPLQGATSPELFSIELTSLNVNDDAFPDYAIANIRDGSLQLIESTGWWGLSLGSKINVQVGSSGPEYLVALDMDQDGDDDLIAVCNDGIVILEQTALGTFTTLTVNLPTISTPAFRSAVFQDFDSSGTGDLAIADENNAVYLIHDLKIDGTYASITQLSDPSLEYPIAIDWVSWDGDATPDIVVANLDGDLVTIFPSSASPVSFSVGHEPRRITVSDLNGDGWRDIITANQGDIDIASNEDVSVILQPTKPSNVTIGIDETITDELGIRLKGTQGVAFASQGSLRVVSKDGRSIHEYNPSPSLNANPNSRKGDVIDFPFELGGIYFTSPNDARLIDRWTGDVYRYRPAQGLQFQVSLPAPSELGYQGLIFQAANYYVSDPAQQKLFVYSSAGALVSSSDTVVPLTELTWNSPTLYGITAGLPYLHAFNSLAVATPTSDQDLTGILAILDKDGFVGITYGASANSFYLMLKTGLILRLDNAFELQDLSTYSPLAGRLSSTLSSSGTELYTLGQDGHLVHFPVNDLENVTLRSLFPLLEADRQFIPNGIVTNGSGELWISDKDTPRIGRFTEENHTFLGIQNSAGQVGAEVTMGQIAVQQGTGDLFFRRTFSCDSEHASIPLSTPYGSSILLSENSLLTQSDNDSALLRFNMENDTVEQLISPTFKSTNASYTLINDQFQMINPDDDSITTITLPPPPSSLVDWMMY